MKTFSLKSADTTRKWHIFDAKGQVLGRLASQVAILLMGKHKAVYTRHIDAGDNVVIINASEIQVTGKKSDQKLYRHHSGFPGGMKVLKYNEVQEAHPERIIHHAISGMLPKNKLQDKMLKHLHIYTGSEHPYTKQFKQETK